MICIWNKQQLGGRARARNFFVKLNFFFPNFFTGFFIYVNLLFGLTVKINFNRLLKTVYAQNILQWGF